jgi:hypothetical protein
VVFNEFSLVNTFFCGAFFFAYGNGDDFHVVSPVNYRVNIFS